MQFTINGG